MSAGHCTQHIAVIRLGLKSDHSVDVLWSEGLKSQDTGGTVIKQESDRRSRHKSTGMHRQNFTKIAVARMYACVCALMVTVCVHT